jgi:hypothetical protein
MRHLNESEIGVYRVGGGRRSPHWRLPWHVDLWMRSWQAEWEEGLWCPRGWTPSGVRRKAKRWMRRDTDLRLHEARYGRNDEARAKRMAS